MRSTVCDGVGNGYGIALCKTATLLSHVLKVLWPNVYCTKMSGGEQQEIFAKRPPTGSRIAV